jgi:anthranilate synthase/aminodeoxychorismate synthase-like glutamine amidotransferase
MILVVDNYDSFTWNLAQAFGALGAEVEVVRNDEVSVSEIETLQPAAVVISPGPKTPAEAGISVEVVSRLSGSLPILGVCLGHQSIAAAFGGKVVRAPRVMHGKVSQVYHGGTGLFDGVPSPFVATRYHSLVVERAGLPDELEVVAWTEDADDGVVQGLRHREHETWGVQFHPESVKTEAGPALLRNLLLKAGCI